MTEPLDELIGEMVSGSNLRVVREALEEAAYGHLLRDARDVASALHSIRSLDPSVRAILESGTASESVKVSIAKKYLNVVTLDVNGKIPPSELRGGPLDEPRFTLEAALFLAERGEYDWNDEEMMRSVLFFASPSRFVVKAPVEVKRAFLSLLVGRLNDDPTLLQRFSSVMLYEDELVRDSMDKIPYSHDPLGLENLGKDKRALLQNIMPLLDSDYKRSSFGLVCGLSCMSDANLEDFFLGMSVLFWRSVPNAVLAFQDMAEGLSGRGITALRLMRKIVEAASRSKDRDVDEQRVKALIRVAESKGECNAEFVGLVRRLLGWHMETDSRLLLFKFVYGKTRDKRIIDEALRFESRKIRAWAKEEEIVARGPSNG